MGLAALPSLSFLLLFFFLSLFLLSIDGEPSKPLCSPFNCGNITNISFPFADINNPRCGFILIECIDNMVARIPILGSGGYVVKNISNSSHSLTVQDIRLTWHLNAKRCDYVSEFAPPSSPYLPLKFSNPMLKIFICNSTQHLNLSRYPSLRSYNSCSSSILYFRRPGHEPQQDQMLDSALSICQSVSYPLLQIPNDSEWGSFNFTSLVINGFPLHWELNKDCVDCQNSGGQCGLDFSKKFLCSCKDGTPGKFCKSGNKSKKWLKITIGTSLATGTLTGAACFIFFYYHRHNKNSSSSSLFLTESMSSNPPINPDHEKGSTTQFLTNIPTLSLFTYKELQQATNNFSPSNELGNGGFGAVYFGNLRDGRSVAVKRLYEKNHRRVEQFMNEVTILSSLRHPNLVCLYGCTSRHTRELLLVYEYIPNGTVADHIHGDHAKVNGGLNWSTRLKIAIQTAEALSFLHAVDPPIIHRDVKTNNILLDNSFGVKVADFGLSRFFPLDMTHVSTAPQGTPGYVDPDYHQCYQLTDKSDVYSFGVVLVELISSKPAVDITRHSHEINLANLAINKIVNNTLTELVDPSLGFDSDCRVRKMVNGVAELAFRCLASEKKDRPSMEEVLEILKGIENDGIEEGTHREQDDQIVDDDVGVLKSQMPISPDSVTEKWTSRSTTPNASNEV